MRLLQLHLIVQAPIMLPQNTITNRSDRGVDVKVTEFTNTGGDMAPIDTLEIVVDGALINNEVELVGGSGIINTPNADLMPIVRIAEQDGESFVTFEFTGTASSVAQAVAPFI